MIKQPTEKEEAQVLPVSLPASLPDKETAYKSEDLPDISARMKTAQRMVRQRNITGKEITLLTVASVIIAALMVLGVIVAQPPAQTRSSSANTTSASSSSATRLTTWLATRL